MWVTGDEVEGKVEVRAWMVQRKGKRVAWIWGQVCIYAGVYIVQSAGTQTHNEGVEISLYMQHKVEQVCLTHLYLLAKYNWWINQNYCMCYCFTSNLLKMPLLLNATLNYHTSENIYTSPGVECPLSTAEACISSSLVASCTRTSASRHKGAINALSQVSPSTTANGQAVRITCVTWLLRDQVPCTHNTS